MYVFVSCKLTPMSSYVMELVVAVASGLSQPLR